MSSRDAKGVAIILFVVAGACLTIEESWGTVAALAAALHDAGGSQLA